jgi:hypothetical protein
MARFTQGGSSNNGGAALNYVQVAGTPQTISTAPNAIVDLDITTTGAPVQISVTGEGANASAGSWLRLNLFRDNTEIGNAIQMESSAASENVPFAINFIDDVAAGTYNYSARVTTITGGNWVFGEADGPVINAVELTGFKGDRGLRGLTGDAGADGAAGTDGADGADGADALWNFTGAYEVGASYAVGDITTYDGETWYRINANGGNTGDTPTEGTFWTLIAQKGRDGSGGGDADIADFVFTSEEGQSKISLPSDRQMRIEAGEDSDLYITSGDDIYIQTVGEADDIHLNAADDIVFTTNNEDSETQRVYEWTMNDSGVFNLPGNGYISNPIDSSGDTATNDTIKIVPDATVGEDQHIVLDPTGPNHIHIRAGGTIDESSAALVLGGERNNVYIEDDSREVQINTRKADIVSTYVNVNGESNESLVVNMPVDISEGSTVNVGDTDYLVTDLLINTPSEGVATVTANGATFVSGETYTIASPSSQNNTWTFDSNGNLTTPNGFVLDYINDEQEESRITVANHDMTLRTTRNPVLEGDDPENAEDADINIEAADDVFVRAYGDEVGVYAASSVTIRTNNYDENGEQNEDNNKEWQFQTDGALRFPDQTVQTTAYTGGAGADTGDITFVDNTISSNTGDDIVIQNKNDDGIVKARITLDQSDEQVLIEAIASDSEWFNDTQWSTAAWNGNTVLITNTPDIINFFNNVTGNVNRVSINDGGLLTYEGASFGAGNMTLNVGGTPPEGQEPLTVTEIRFYYELVSEINIDHDDSEFNIISRGMSMTIDSSGDLDLKARDSDLHLYANDDVRFTANWDSNGTEHSWRMSDTGKFELPGSGYIENPINSSGDGSGYDTIKIVPDAELINQEYHEDQYLIIDPTQPNHIHIRAGGTQDNSTADLFLGAERTNVRVSDSTRQVYVTSKVPDNTNTYENIGGDEPTILYISGNLSNIQSYGNFSVNVDGTLYQIDSVNYNSGANVTQITASPATFVLGNSYEIVETNGENAWIFRNDGYLSGPGEGLVRVAGLYGPEDSVDLVILAPTSLVLDGDGGEFLNDSSNENNQIATIGDISNAVPVETSFTVNGGTLGTQPTFDGAPLFSGTYVQNGPLVHFQIEVDMDNITNFGTGQYYVNLPFPAKYSYHFRDACLHDNSGTVRQYALSGHVYAGQSQVTLWFTSTSGQDELFDYNSPALLTVNDNFHISGTYISE